MIRTVITRTLSLIGCSPGNVHQLYFRGLIYIISYDYLAILPKLFTKHLTKTVTSSLAAIHLQNCKMV